MGVARIPNSMVSDDKKTHLSATAIEKKTLDAPPHVNAGEKLPPAIEAKSPPETLYPDSTLSSNRSVATDHVPESAPAALFAQAMATPFAGTVILSAPPLVLLVAVVEAELETKPVTAQTPISTFAVLAPLIVTAMSPVVPVVMGESVI